MLICRLHKSDLPISPCQSYQLIVLFLLFSLSNSLFSSCSLKPVSMDPITMS